ncbi:MAG: EamA family transporter [Rhodospirillaceae bacterium]|nr:EamA family transporter [Rhodospirillales bacterium]
MNAALWGLAAALAFGTADFCGRFTGRALGPASAMLGLMLVGAVILTLYGGASGMSLDWDAENGWALVIAGLTAMLAPLAFYRSMTLAPLSLVMPITAGYPALIVPVNLVLGTVPSPLQWLGMAGTGLGAIIVARTAADDPDSAISADPANRRRAIAFAALAAALFAVTLLVGQHAAAGYGEERTLWFGRLAGAGLLLAAFAARRRLPRLPLRWWPILAVQGSLDALAYFFFYLGAKGEDAPIAAVASSAFMVVGVLLGWAILKERMGLACWSGVALVFAGIAILSLG